MWGVIKSHPHYKFLLGPAILTRSVNPTRTQHEISEFGFTLNRSCHGSLAGDLPDPFKFFFFFFFFNLKKKR
jgi:hypothetical protein